MPLYNTSSPSGKDVISTGVYIVLQIQSHVSFLHEELLKLPSFPRKALESEFGLHTGVMEKVSLLAYTNFDYLSLSFPALSTNSVLFLLLLYNAFSSVTIVYVYFWQEIAGVDFLHKYAWTKVCINELEI